MDFILQQDNGQARFVQAVTELSKAYALVATHDEAIKLREEVAFFQCSRAQFAKLSDEIKSRSRKNLVRSRSFAEMLEKTIKKYQNRTIDAAQVIAELVALAKEMREARQRGESLGLTEDEEAFYEALEVNDSAVAVLGDKALCAIARELVDTVRRTVTIDWTVKDSVRARLRVMVKKILKRHGYHRTNNRKPPRLFQSKQNSYVPIGQPSLLGFVSKLHYSRRSLVGCECMVFASSRMPPKRSFLFRSYHGLNFSVRELLEQSNRPSQLVLRRGQLADSPSFLGLNAKADQF
jgi:hypothetical protein